MSPQVPGCAFCFTQDSSPTFTTQTRLLLRAWDLPPQILTFFLHLYLKISISVVNTPSILRWGHRWLLANLFTQVPYFLLCLEEMALFLCFGWQTPCFLLLPWCSPGALFVAPWKEPCKPLRVTAVSSPASFLALWWHKSCAILSWGCS